MDGVKRRKMVGDLRRGGDEIGDHDDVHPCASGTFDSRQGIFQDEAIGGLHAKATGGQ